MPGPRASTLARLALLGSVTGVGTPRSEPAGVLAAIALLLLAGQCPVAGRQGVCRVSGVG